MTDIRTVGIGLLSTVLGACAPPVLPIGPLLTLVLFDEVKFLETLMENTVIRFFLNFRIITDFVLELMDSYLGVVALGLKSPK